VPDYKALDGPARRAIKAGIPVIAANAVDPRPKDERIPYLFFVGTDNRLAGQRVAEEILRVRIPKHAVVGYASTGNIVEELRAQGVRDVMKKAGVEVDSLVVTTDPTKATEAIRGYFMNNPKTDFWVSLTGLTYMAAIDCLTKAHLEDKVLHVSFDLDKGKIDAIKKGLIHATVDQQTYLQGYLPIEWLYLYKKYGFCPASDILTGPAIITKENVQLVEKGSQGGYR
jgi:simple sugar transport system substrate-binding protein